MITNKIVEITANQTELKKNLLDWSSRFQKSQLIYYSDFNILTFATYDRVYNPATATVKVDNVKYYQIKKATQYKPWLISDDVYNDSGYGWLIMEFNNVFDVEELRVGRTLRIPPITLAQ